MVQNILVTAPTVKRELTVNANIPETLDELVKKYGAAVVAAKAVDAIVIAAQGYVRNKLQRTGDKRMDDKAVTADFAKWVPAIGRDPKKKMDTLKAKLDALTDEERKAIGLPAKPKAK